MWPLELLLWRKREDHLGAFVSSGVNNSPVSISRIVTKSQRFIVRTPRFDTSASRLLSLKGTHPWFDCLMTCSSLWGCRHRFLYLLQLLPELLPENESSCLTPSVQAGLIQRHRYGWLKKEPAEYLVGSVRPQQTLPWSRPQQYDLHAGCAPIWLFKIYCFCLAELPLPLPPFFFLFCFFVLWLNLTFLGLR